jgi:putrescine aminotransferase
LFEPVGEVGVMCRNHAIADGMMMRAVRDGMILSPPLTFSCDDIDKAVEIATRALDKTASDLNVN